MGWDNRTSLRVFSFGLLLFASVNRLFAEPTKRVLIINSYHPGYGWSDDELSGLTTTLRNHPDVEVYVEFADSQRHFGQDYNAAWLAFINHKYQKIQLDLLIATDDYGVARALDVRAALNLKLPIVFCGVNDYKGDSWILRKPQGAGLVGVLEKVTHLETASMALRLLPNSKQIVVVDPDCLNDYAGDLQRAFPGVSARCLQSHEHSLADLAAELARLKEGDLVIAPFFADSNGQLTTMASSIRWVIVHTRVPVFGISKRSLGSGIIGGKLADGFFQGRTAAEMVLRILNGTSPWQLNNVTDAGEPYTVDYSAMRRWNLEEARLPSDSVVVGRPVTLYQQHKTELWAVLAFVTLQSAVIGLLVLEVRRRKKTEETLATTAQTYRTIFEQSPVGIAELSPQGTWLLANDKACEIIGETRQSRLGRTFEDVVSADDWKLLCEARANLIAGKLTSSSGELEVTQKSGRKIWIYRTSSLINDADSKPRVLLLLEDITRRKGAEQQLLRSNATLRHFAYAAAHDLQEPLRNVALSSDLLMTDYQDQFDEIGQRLLKENLDGAQRMLGMVKALLQYSAAVDSNHDHSAEVVPAETALSVALQNLQVAIKEAGVTVEHSTLPLVAATETHLVALFQNLIGNAVKYRRSDTPALVRVSAQPSGNEWLFEVADNGIGFEAKYADRIFGVFKRLHSRKDYPGTGIGLAICARIVEHYGGRIWAESKPSAGAKFFFSLPAVSNGKRS